MLHSSFFWKLYSGYVALIILAVSVAGILISRRTQQDTLWELRESLEVTAFLLRDLSTPNFLSGSAPPGPELQQRIEGLGQQVGPRLTLIRRDGRVIADSMEDPSQMDNHGSRPEILSALSHQSGTSTRFSETLGTPMLYFALPVRTGGELVGYVRTALPLTVVNERVGRLQSTLILSIVLSAAVALGLGFFFARRFTRPLQAMTVAAQGMADGDYGQVMPISRTDEVGRLARVLRQMEDSSRERLETINNDRKKLLAILGGMVEGVVAVDQSEGILHMNAVAGEILNTSPQESLGVPLWQVTRVQEVVQFLGKVVKDQIPAERELQLRDGRGERTIRMLASPLRDGEGNPAGAVLVLDDVSELNRLERIRQDFVANVSHELKTPIAAIRALAETLVDDSEMAPETRTTFLVKIKNQSLRLSSMVSELLTLARLETEGGPERYTSLDLRDPVRAAVEALTQGAEEKDISLGLKLPEDPVRVLGDWEDLKQVTGNLVDNGLKYTQGGGSVSVEVHVTGSSAVLEVRDTGVGIAPADQQRVFERFYRVDRARSTALGGTGLGLAIVKHIVQAHRGNVSLESVPGTGSTFCLSIPLASGES